MKAVMNGTVKLNFEAECTQFFLDQLPINYSAVACVVGNQMFDMTREDSLIAQTQINAKTTQSGLSSAAFEQLLQTSLNMNGTIFVAQLKALQDADSKVAFANLTSITALAPVSPPMLGPVSAPTLLPPAPVNGPTLPIPTAAAPVSACRHRRPR